MGCVFPLREDVTVRGKVRCPQATTGVLQARQRGALQVVGVELLDSMSDLAEQQTPAIRRPVPRLYLTVQVVERQVGALARAGIPEQRAFEPRAVSRREQAHVAGQGREHVGVYTAVRSIPQLAELRAAGGVKR